MPCQYPDHFCPGIAGGPYHTCPYHGIYLSGNVLLLILLLILLLLLIRFTLDELKRAVYRTAMAQYKSPQSPLFQRGAQVVAFFKMGGTVHCLLFEELSTSSP